MQDGVEVNLSRLITQTYKLAEECVKTNYYGPITSCLVACNLNYLAFFICYLVCR
ncbi:hypothetical protein RchiOBHm_Chr2g0150091 [Rosa chinensis]|uniref:Uncharacterized protein n=1 Tax=Rosa chinensis TaxID=74649 RepID=A0A2P6RZV5_ROSCH|nr:hypothetical protein RchiOBHm_Chr2g0150091 [Rosa chinensis]